MHGCFLLKHFSIICTCSTSLQFILGWHNVVVIEISIILKRDRPEAKTSNFILQNLSSERVFEGMCLSCTLLRWKLKGGKMTHTTSRPYSGLGHLGNTRPGLSKIWLKYAFYLLTNFWTQTYGKVFVFCQHSTLYTRLQHSTTQPPVLLVFLPLECRHVPVHRAPACAPLMQHSWSAGRREEGGRRCTYPSRCCCWI